MAEKSIENKQSVIRTSSLCVSWKRLSGFGSLVADYFSYRCFNLTEKAVNHMFTKRIANKNHYNKKEGGFIPILIVLIIVIVGIVLLVHHGSHSKPFKASDISVDGVKNSKETIVDSNYTLKYKITGVSGRLINTTVTTNDGTAQKVVQNSTTGSDLNFALTPVIGTHFGDNDITIAVTETTSSGVKPLGSKKIVLTLNSSAIPIIKVQNAQENNGNLLIGNVLDKTYSIQIDTRTGANTVSGATSVTVDNMPAKFGAVAGSFEYDTPLNEGDNNFVIVAKNSLGQVTSNLDIQKPTQASLSQQGALTNAILDAETSCQEYAEKKFNVKDINLSKDQSSITRQNADGTILIKENIADSEGFFKPEKPLGTMECTTSSDSLTILSFTNY